MQLDKVPTLIASLGFLLALGAGGVLALQPAANGRLASACEHPLQASIISFGTGFAALLLLGFALRVGTPTVAKLHMLPIWAWTGGLLGTYMVTVSFLIAPRIGATRWLVLVLTGQIVLSLVLDHFGLIGYAKQQISWFRVLGIAFVVLGAAIVIRH